MFLRIMALDFLRMSLTNHRIAELLGEVRRIFKAVPRPECTKRVGLAFDDEWFVSDQRWKELNSLDLENHWWEVPDSELLEFSSVLVWLLPDGLHFYYPAFLSYTLRHWYDNHDRVHLETLETLGITTLGKRGKRRMLEKLECFSAEELMFIAETITELSCDPKGENYYSVLTIIAAEAMYRQKLNLSEG